MEAGFNAALALEQKAIKNSKAIGARKHAEFDADKMFGYQSVFHIEPKDVPDGMQAGYVITHVEGEPYPKSMSKALRAGWRPAEQNEMPAYEKEFMGARLMLRTMDVADLEKQYFDKKLQEDLDVVNAFETKPNVGPLSRNFIDPSKTKRTVGFGFTNDD
jgi:hypothetical protein